jgi:predicted S18 family serine protease
MTDVEVAELTQRMKDRSLGDGISAGLCADLQRAAALIERLAAEKAEADEAMRQQAVIIANSVARTRLTEAESLLRDDFHMAYRMKCDEQTKTAESALAQCRALLSERVEMCAGMKDEITALRERVAEARETYDRWKADWRDVYQTAVERAEAAEARAEAADRQKVRAYAVADAMEAQAKAAEARLSRLMAAAKPKYTTGRDAAVRAGYELGGYVKHYIVPVEVVHAIRREMGKA